VGTLVRCKYVGRLVATGEVFERVDDTGYRIGDSDTTPGTSLSELTDGVVCIVTSRHRRQ
jgi:hypothetical protein